MPPVKNFTQYASGLITKAIFERSFHFGFLVPVSVSIALLATSTAHASTPAYFRAPPTEIPFFRSPTSQFASGFQTREKLNQFATSQQIVIPESIRLFLKDSAQGNSEVTLSKSNYSTAQELNNPYHVGDIKRDLGFIEIVQETHLFKNPNKFSPKLLKLSPGQKLKAQYSEFNLKNGFIKIRLGGKSGYVDLSHVLTKFDFAVWVYLKSAATQDPAAGWVQAESRVFDEVQLASGKTARLHEIEGLWVDSNKAIVTQDTEQTKRWTRLEIKREPSKTWKSSRLRGHGTVWWLDDPSTANQGIREQQSRTIHIDELLRRKISSVSFHPRNPKKAIVSAKGVFITADGTHWTEVSQFKDYSGPVYYYNDLMLFVGNHRSTDGGKTFDPFIKITDLASTIQAQTGQQPKRLELKSITTRGPMQLEIKVHTGLRELRVQSPLYLQNWTVVAEPAARALRSEPAARVVHTERDARAIR